MSQSQYIAHRADDGREQPLCEHLKNVAELAGGFAKIFGAEELARVIGRCHDLGKYSKKFQRKIHGAKIKVDHSTAGGRFLRKSNQNVLGLIAAYCVMGHHAGLPDGGVKKIFDADGSTLYDRLNLKKLIEPYDGYKADMREQIISPPKTTNFDMFEATFLTRFLFSALVDADYLDTEAFFDGEKNALRGGTTSITELYVRMRVRIEKYLNPERAVSPLDAKRTELLKNCLIAAEAERGLFTLTAPTGSGKTIASLAFALTNAFKHGLRRVIYVVPYNTIIEQNAKVFENILGAENVLQNHSNINYDGDENADENNRKRLSAENWDYPLIVTSSVQFFESLFASRTSKCRKLHNIAGSVIIFDEAQMIPRQYLIPCVNAIKELVQNYNCTAVLATATQSSLDRFFAPLALKEITEQPVELYNLLKRAEIRRIDDPLADDDLAERLNAQEQVLCIVNTRKHAQFLFKKLQKGEGTIHLSTTMYPEHRTRVLETIRQRLKDELPCRVVSTSMVEAGVDLDFPAVYREIAGLDSIIQAAGRCNREGKRSPSESIVYVFKSAEHNATNSQGTAIGAYEGIAPGFQDISSLEAVKAYFDRLFYNEGDEHLDKKNIMKYIRDGANDFSIPFREIADNVKIIDNDTQDVYYLSKAQELEARLRDGERSRALFREIGKYRISLYRHEVQNMLRLGEVMKLNDYDNEVLLLNEAYYDEDYGVKLNLPGGMGIFN